MQETNWNPTEDELIALGFEYKDFFGYWDFDCGNLTYDHKGFIIAPKQPYGFRRTIICVMQIYPKSLEELKTLLSMMNP